MSSVNKVTILGRVGKDPEIRSFQNGGRVANFSVATSEKWKDKNTGEKREKTEWHNVSVTSDGLIKVIESYVKKGTNLYLEGKLQTRKWQDQNGTDRYTTEVTLSGFGSQLVLLGGGSGNGQGDYQSNQSQAKPFEDHSQDFEDEIPF